MSTNKIIPIQIPKGVTVLREHHFDFASIMLRSDGITQINSKEDIQYTLIWTKQVHSTVNVLNENQPILILHVPGKHTNVDDESRKFLASEQGVHNRTAIAFVLQSLGQRLVANFYIKMNKPKVPTKFFNIQAEAESWLLSIKQNNTI